MREEVKICVTLHSWCLNRVDFFFGVRLSAVAQGQFSETLVRHMFFLFFEKSIHQIQCVRGCGVSRSTCSRQSMRISKFDNLLSIEIALWYSSFLNRKLQISKPLLETCLCCKRTNQPKLSVHCQVRIKFLFQCALEKCGWDDGFLGRVATSTFVQLQNWQNDFHVDTCYYSFNLMENSCVCASIRL